MKDIPLFHTENGIASLRLKEIPFFQTAYITIQSALDEEKLLQDCISLCKAAGADRVFATGIEDTQRYSAVNIVKMTRDVTDLEPTDAMLFPLQENTISQWREIYNQKMRYVTGAAYMNDVLAKEILVDKKGYFIHKNGELMGIGTACGDTISVVASVKKGAGKEILMALLSALPADRAVVEVASDNQKATDLYSALGFTAVAIVNTWYKIF